MSTDISLRVTQYQVENRNWLLSEHGTEPGTTPSISIDTVSFNALPTYALGYIPSGVVVEPSPAGYVPYQDAAATPGVGILFSTISFDPANPAASIGGAVLIHGFVDATRLPIQAGDGSLGVNGASDLPLIHFIT